MGLSGLSIKLKYKSIFDDILNDFYIPVLSNSIYYYRAVGYFSSTILVEYAKGLKQFINRNGKMKLIISPYLIPADFQAIHYEYNQEYTKGLVNVMFEEFLNGSEEVVASSKLLVMLLELGYLEIMVAEPQNHNGLFHEKIGLFYDEFGNSIAISGSNNETGRSILLNHESFNTFCSWKEGQLDYIIDHENDFKAYWNKQYPNIRTYDLSEAIDKELLKKFKTNESVEELFSMILKEDFKISILDFEPYSYQKEAVDIWLQNKQGIFKFATGAGKTKSAIYLMERLKETYKSLFYLIVVPDKTLVNQWTDELNTYQFSTLKCYSDNRDWNKTLKDKIDIFLMYDSKYEYIIVTNDTFFNERFQRELLKLKNNFMLVVDECHTWGTDRILANLPNNKMRLGLSATPELFFSQEKTEKLINFFGGITYEYSLERAISEDRLVGYYYYPIFVQLNQDEKAEYDVLTHKIVKIIGRDVEDISDVYDKAVEMLLFKRARIVYGAKSKLNKLIEIIPELSQKGRLLIYCGPTTYISDAEDDLFEVSMSQLQAVNKILGNLGIKFAQYTSKEDEQDRINAINAFKNDTYSTLVAIKCLDEGINIPQIERAIILASSTNPREFIQRRGRILRHHLGKKFSEIYDFIVLEEDYERLVKKELERFYEFARLAINYREIELKYGHLLNKYLFERGSNNE
ncbi:MAG TPA: DEAD/DEAH box helicase family protein [Gallicola sp.]|nr:DEAD/DEAH box helicase family protein [Gallicola sp.]